MTIEEKPFLDTDRKDDVMYGTRFRDFRDGLDLNVAQVAQCAGVTSADVRWREAGMRSMTVETDVLLSALVYRTNDALWEVRHAHYDQIVMDHDFVFYSDMPDFWKDAVANKASGGKKEVVASRRNS